VQDDYVLNSIDLVSVKPPWALFFNEEKSIVAVYQAIFDTHFSQPD
jgi:hypothetical protein